jgi:hypothetical protein
MKIAFLIIISAFFVFFFCRGDRVSKEAASIQDGGLDYVKDLRVYAGLSYFTAVACAIAGIACIVSMTK